MIFRGIKRLLVEHNVAVGALSLAVVPLRGLLPLQEQLGRGLRLLKQLHVAVVDALGEAQSGGGALGAAGLLWKMTGV